jgi:hypothetical protein
MLLLGLLWSNFIKLFTTTVFFLSLIFMSNFSRRSLMPLGSSIAIHSRLMVSVLFRTPGVTSRDQFELHCLSNEVHPEDPKDTTICIQNSWLTRIRSIMKPTEVRKVSRTVLTAHIECVIWTCLSNMCWSLL